MVANLAAVAHCGTGAGGNNLHDLEFAVGAGEWLLSTEPIARRWQRASIYREGRYVVAALNVDLSPSIDSVHVESIRPFWGGIK